MRFMVAVRAVTNPCEPEAVKRVWIPKANSEKMRPLGIPTITDRVVQTAALLVLKPVFESDLADEQYAYRPDRGAHDAVQAVHGLLNRGYTQVVDADLSGYFDSIAHAELLLCVARRVVDRHILSLVKAWLVSPVDSDDGPPGTTRSLANRDNKRGTPQGTPISPLLSHLYMRPFRGGSGWAVSNGVGDEDRQLRRRLCDLLQALYGELGLVRLASRTHNLPWATA